MDKIIARIARELARGDAVDGLVDRLSPTDLQSLMLHVYRQRSRRRSPADLLSSYERATMLRPSSADGRRVAELGRAAFECAARFEAIEPSPLAPLGLNSVLGGIDQNNCLATIRGAEVLADATTVSALECARRRRAGETGTIRLCSMSRQLRLQPFDNPSFSPHFELYAMVTAGRDRGGLLFEMDSLREHIGVYLALFAHLETLDYGITDIEVNVSDTERDARRLRLAEEEVLGKLAAAHPSTLFRIDTTREQGRNYYTGLCIGIHAKDPEGRRMNLADGGFTNWTQRLLSNAKERLFVSGLGIELLAKRFGRPPAGPGGGAAGQASARS